MIVYYLTKFNYEIYFIVFESQDLDDSVFFYQNDE